MRIVFNQRPTAALHQPYGDPSTFFAPELSFSILDPMKSSLILHTGSLVKMLTT